MLLKASLHHLVWRGKKGGGGWGEPALSVKKGWQAGVAGRPGDPYTHMRVDTRLHPTSGRGTGQAIYSVCIWQKGERYMLHGWRFPLPEGSRLHV